MDDDATPRGTPTVAVAGAASLDMMLRRPPPGWIGEQGQDCYTPETIHSLDQPPELGLGGNGAAAAYVLGKLGVSVALNGPTGDDAAGQLVRGWLSEANVMTFSRPDCSTMCAITAVDARSNRLGCLQYASPPIDWMRSAHDERATWLLIAAHSQIEADALQGVCDALSFFRSCGGTTVLDAGIGWMRSNDAEQMRSVWSEVDLLVGTLDELRFWTGLHDPGEVGQRALFLGAGRVVVKMGSEGAGWISEEGVYTHQPARRVERSDVSVGAGDGFNGALIARLVHGASLETSVSFAQTVAARIVEIGHGVIGWGRRWDPSAQATK